jgi:CBS domain-containing protein
VTRIPSELGGSYLISSFSTASVAEAMRHGVISCRPDASLTTVARMMASNHVHSIVVSDTLTGEAGESRPWGIVQDVDLVGAGPEAESLTAADVSTSDVVTVDRDETVARAAELMAQHRTSHLIVVDSAEHPIGVISTLDLAGIIAWGRA